MPACMPAHMQVRGSPLHPLLTHSPPQPAAALRAAEEKARQKREREAQREAEKEKKRMEKQRCAHAWGVRAGGHAPACLPA